MIEIFKDYIEYFLPVVMGLVTWIFANFFYWKKPNVFVPSGTVKFNFVIAITIITTIFLFLLNFSLDSLDGYEPFLNKLNHNWTFPLFIVGIIFCAYTLYQWKKEEKEFILGDITSRYEKKISDLEQSLKENHSNQIKNLNNDFEEDKLLFEKKLEEISANEEDEILQEFLEKGAKFTTADNLKLLGFLRKLTFELAEKFDALFKDGFIIRKLIITPVEDIAKLNSRTRTEMLLSTYIVKRIEEEFPALSENILLDVDDKDSYTLLVGNTRWIIDAIDGSRHLVNNIPLYGCSICLQERKSDDENWKTKIGMSFFHKTNEFFFAFDSKDLGTNSAFVNNWIPLKDKREEKSISDSIFYLEFPGNKSSAKLQKYGKDEEAKMVYKESGKLLNIVTQCAAKVRGFNMGSFGISYVAKGSFDVYLSIPGTTSPFDSYAALFIAEKSGLKIIQKEGIIRNEKANFDLGSRTFVSTNKVYQELVGKKEYKQLRNFLNNLFDGQFE